MIEQIMEFNHLSINFTSSGNLVKWIKIQAKNAARLAGYYTILFGETKYEVGNKIKNM